MKTLKIFSFIVLLSGCTRTINTSFDIDDLSPNEGKGLVLMRSYVKAFEDRNFRIMQSTWRKRGENAIFRTDFKHLGLVRINHEKIRSYSLEPGKYDLEGLFFHGCGFFGSGIGGGIFAARHLKNVASFEVKAGDVIYVGDLCLDANISSIVSRAIRIENHFDVAKKYLAENYPQLENKLEEKPIQLSKLTTLIQGLDQNSIDAAIDGLK